MDPEFQEHVARRIEESYNQAVEMGGRGWKAARPPIVPRSTIRRFKRAFRRMIRLMEDDTDGPKTGHAVRRGIVKSQWRARDRFRLTRDLDYAQDELRVTVKSNRWLRQALQARREAKEQSQPSEVQE